MGTHTTPAFEMQTKRLLLFSTKIRFSPETQPLRDTAIDKLIEQSLLLSDDGMTMKQLDEQNVLCFLQGTSALPRRDFEAALRRLTTSGRVRTQGEGVSARYVLADRIRAELWQVQSQAEQRFKTIVNKLFTGVDGGAQRYGAAFLECLCRIFARLGETFATSKVS